MFDTTTAIFDARASARPGSTSLKHVVVIGNFPPRQCGIATFTADIVAALHQADPALKVSVLAMEPQGVRHDYGDAVQWVVEENDREAYLAAADEIANADADLICVQHEFGIFGGSAGAHLLDLLNAVATPVATTFHTIVSAPNPDQLRVMKALIARSSRLVVMTRKGRALLMQHFGAPASKIVVIPHGAPDRPLAATDASKRLLGLDGRDVILTFGLLGPGKGLEHVIRAMPRVVARDPAALYLILGATHPNLIAREGEAYRDGLAALAQELGVGAHVRFVNDFVSLDDLLEYLAAADIYATPYLNEAQITSGTLSYAVALGKPVVSTPYWHAAELLANDVGVLTPFGDVDAIGDALSDLLLDSDKRRRMAKRAYEKGRESTWAQVGALYRTCFVEALKERRAKRWISAAPMPSVNFAAIDRMTDACGMLQHGLFHLPDRRHGYCVDDNARALMLAVLARDLGVRSHQLERLATIYATFVNYAWNEDTGRFRNFMSYERTWLERAGSDDSSGRSFWALGVAARRSESRDMRSWAIWAAERAVHPMMSLKPHRARAFCVLGFNELAAIGVAKPQAHAFMENYGAAMLRGLEENGRADWRWFEPCLSYDNARLCEALIRAGLALDRQDFIAAGLQTLSWLVKVQMSPAGHFRAVGNQSFGAAYVLPKRFDQQPLEAVAMIDASWAAFDATEDPNWRDEAARAFAWYFGENDLREPLATPDGAGCFDGLHAAGVNENQGAESMLSLQLAICSMRRRALLAKSQPAL